MNQLKIIIVDKGKYSECMDTPEKREYEATVRMLGVYNGFEKYIEKLNAEYGNSLKFSLEPIHE